jgi:hypothetical protein
MAFGSPIYERLRALGFDNVFDVAKRQAARRDLGEESSFDLGLKIKGDGHGRPPSQAVFSFPIAHPTPALSLCKLSGVKLCELFGAPRPGH